MKILSIDCGIKTLAICCLELDKISKKQIDYIYKTANTIKKGCETLESKLNEEQNLKAQMILLELKDVKRNALLQKSFKILHWEKINLFPIPEHLKKLKCSLCKCTSAFYQKKNNEYIGFCKRHNKKTDAKLFDIKEKLVKDIPIKILCQTAVKCLDKRPQLLDVDTVLIEQQPSKNSRMKNFQNVLYSYFIIRGSVDKDRIKSIYFVSPKHKLKSYFDQSIRNEIFKLFAESKQKSNYDKNKEVSVKLTLKILKRSPENIKWLQTLEESKYKMDDLCDAFLQAYSYVDLLI